MKPRHSRRLPQALFLCLAPLLACATAHASVITFDEQSQTNDFVFPTGTNLLATATASGSPAIHEASSASWSVLTDGQFGDNADNSATVTPNNGDQVVYTLDTSGANGGGYTITSFDSYGGWANSGRDNQDYTLEYSVVGDESTFHPLATIASHTGEPYKSTHSVIRDTTGVLATNVAAIRITFVNGQENGYAGYREFILRGTPLYTTLNEANTTNLWTLPTGVNLLNGNTAGPPPAINHAGDVGSGTWATVTNNTVGIASDTTASVIPNNNDVITFPLDTSVNTKGYNLTSLDTYCAWPNSGRDNQDFSVRYATADAPGVFKPLAIVVNHTTVENATHTRITPASGFLAQGVVALQFYFNNSENGYVGYREFIALGSAVPLTDPLTWSGLTNGVWSTDPDNNWKTGSGTAPFTSQAPVTFDDTGINRNISVPADLSTASITLANDTVGYEFSGEGLLTVSNAITSTGAGSASFANPVKATTGVTVSGSGSLAFDSSLESPGLVVSGTGSLLLNHENDNLSGVASVSSGTLSVNDDYAMSGAGLSLSGGTVDFTTEVPLILTLSGSGGQIVLGDSAGSVNTQLTVGDNTSVTVFSGNISEAPGTVGSFFKTNQGSLTLAGDNTYTGSTTVNGGILQLIKRTALYHGDTTRWTASNIIVGGNTTLGLNIGGAGEFTDADLTALDTGGFALDANLSLTAAANFTVSRSLSGQMNLVTYMTTPTASLTLTGASTFTGRATVIQGDLKLANPGGFALSGDVYMGNTSNDTSVTFGADNQLKPTSVIHFNNGYPNAKLNLNGTSQTIGGLDSDASNRVSIIQNEENGVGDYVTPPVGTPPGNSVLTINATSDHSFYGGIRNQDGGSVSLVKNGPGTQEFGTIAAVAYNFGDTMLNEGKIRLKFDSARSGAALRWYGSIQTAANTTLEFNAEAETNGWIYWRPVYGAGKIVKTGAGAVLVINQDGVAKANTYSGGTEVQAGALILQAGPVSTGEGTAPGQGAVAGLMDPANIITVDSGATLAFGGAAALGNSNLLPQYGNTIKILPGGHLVGGGTALTFLPNLNLDGATVEVQDGYVANNNDFFSNMTFVGTVVVGGTSTTASSVTTTGTNAGANISLGSNGLPGTTFQVADVTGDANPDFTVSAVLRDITTHPSPLVKTGPGTMVLSGIDTYTGDTTVSAGVLSVASGDAIADGNKLILNGGKLDLAANETVGTLFFGGVQQVAGTYGSTSSSATHRDDTRFSGTGILTVTSDASTATPFDTYASVIPDPSKRGKNDDADGDGLTNFQEFLFGLSPIASNGSLLGTTTSANGITLSWQQRADATYVLQESTDLETWTTSGITPAAAADQSHVYSADYVQTEAVLPFAAGKKFVRVQATSNVP